MLATEKISFRLSNLLADELSSRSSEAGISVSEYVRHLVVAALQQDKAEYEFPSHAKWAKAIRLKAHGKCERCERERYCAAHHKIPVADGGKHVLSNGKLLCRRCHIEEHGKGRDSKLESLERKREQGILPKLSEVKSYQDALMYTRRQGKSHSISAAIAVCVHRGIDLPVGGEKYIKNAGRWVLGEESFVRCS